METAQSVARLSLFKNAIYIIRYGGRGPFSHHETGLDGGSYLFLTNTQFPCVAQMPCQAGWTMRAYRGADGNQFLGSFVHGLFPIRIFSPACRDQTPRYSSVGGSFIISRIRAIILGRSAMIFRHRGIISSIAPGRLIRVSHKTGPISFIKRIFSSGGNSKIACSSSSRFITSSPFPGRLAKRMPAHVPVRLAGMSNTEASEWRATLWLTLPKKSSSTNPRPWLPMTTSGTLRSRMKRVISVKGEP